MTTRVHYHERNRNLSADEEAMLNDLCHEVGCGCPECRPDMYDIEAAESAAKEAA